jgi:hypothetical protein
VLETNPTIKPHFRPQTASALHPTETKRTSADPSPSAVDQACTPGKAMAKQSIDALICVEKIGSKARTSQKNPRSGKNHAQDSDKYGFPTWKEALSPLGSP